MQRTPHLRIEPPAAATPIPAPRRGGLPRHVAIIMDGNGRWATARNRPRTVGHVAGVRAVRRTVDAAVRAGIETLTLFAFSGDNWRRPGAEVSALMRLFRRYLAGETARCVTHGVRLFIVGRRDRLDPALRTAIDAAERATAAGTRLRLRIAVDYSARDTILRAAAVWRDMSRDDTTRLDPMARDAHGDAHGDALLAARLGDDAPTFADAIAAAMHDALPAPDVDLLVRTGGERRLSDFLLWECAYAELWFTDVMWPDFGAADLARALADFAARERRFGALPAVAPHARRASTARPR